MSPPINTNAAAGISFSQMQGMDIESLLMAVQSNRANLLEEQLMGEMKNVQAKNEQIAALNGKLTTLTAASQMAYKDADAKPETGLSDAQKAELKKIGMPGKSTEQTAADWQSKVDYFKTPGRYADLPNPTLEWAQDQADCKVYPYSRRTVTTKGDLDKAVTELKGQVDSMGSTQQMDMLRLQSLSNKRNEAFDLMTNFMKKFADKRDAIIGNMR
jgi:hypothetical protein